MSNLEFRNASRIFSVVKSCRAKLVNRKRETRGSLRNFADKIVNEAGDKSCWCDARTCGNLGNRFPLDRHGRLGGKPQVRFWGEANIKRRQKPAGTTENDPTLRSDGVQAKTRGSGSIRTAKSLGSDDRTSTKIRRMSGRSTAGNMPISAAAKCETCGIGNERRHGSAVSDDHSRATRGRTVSSKARSI